MTQHINPEQKSVDASRQYGMHNVQIEPASDSLANCHDKDGIRCDLLDHCRFSGYDRDPFLPTCPKLRGKKVSL